MLKLAIVVAALYWLYTRNQGDVRLGIGTVEVVR